MRDGRVSQCGDLTGVLIVFSVHNFLACERTFDGGVLRGDFIPSPSVAQCQGIIYA